RSAGARYGLHFRQFGIRQEAARRRRAQRPAEVHAEAARDFIMPELATRADVLAVRTDLLATEQRLQNAMESLALRLTVRFGASNVVGIGNFATIFTILKFV